MHNRRFVRLHSRIFQFDHSVYYGTLFSGVQTVGDIHHRYETRGGLRVPRQASGGPDFLVIGAQKAGTSWLHEQLNQHPRVWMPREKELHFFDFLDAGHPRNPVGRMRVAGWQANYNRTRAKRALRNAWRERGQSGTLALAAYHLGFQTVGSYRRIFANKEGYICGESTPDYSTLSDEAVRFVASEFPNLKLVLTLRDPVERRWSNKLHVIRAGGIDVSAMSEADLDDLLIDDDRSEYRTIIENWTRHFPTRQLGIFFYDDLEQDPVDYLAQICDFLGIEPLDPQNGFEARVNETRHLGEIPKSLRRKYAAEFEPLYEWLEETFSHQSQHPQSWRKRAKTEASKRDT